MNGGLSREQKQWLDRLAALYDDYELFPDMRPIGELVDWIMRKMWPDDHPILGSRDAAD